MAIIVSTIPAPYREKVYEWVAQGSDGGFHVIYPSHIEPNRKWDIREGDYSRSFLRKSYISYRGRYIHVHFSVWTELTRLSPDIVITVGFNPTHLVAFAWAIFHRRKHVPFIDGFLVSEAELSPIHFLVRRIVYRFSAAAIGASKRSLEMFRHYGVAAGAVFQSHLCADNERYAPHAADPKRYDLVFSGQIIERKMPSFFVQVAVRIAARRPGLRVLVLGDGPDREAMLASLRGAGIEHHYAGYRSQGDLPSDYASARILLFPSLQEPWGVVANEALAAGVPVMTTPNVGAAGELVVHGENGYVLDPDPDIWSVHALRLLEDTALWGAFSRRALESVKPFEYKTAAEGILAAIRHCRGARDGAHGRKMDGPAEIG